MQYLHVENLNHRYQNVYLIITPSYNIRYLNLKNGKMLKEMQYPCC